MYRTYFHLYLCLISFIILSSCNDKSQVYRRMTLIDSLTYRNMVDSAYYELSKIQNIRMSDEENAYYGILLTRVKYMQRNPLVSDSLVNQSIVYYKGTGELDKLADAYLIKGKILYYKGSIKQSISCLKECEKIIGNINNLSLQSELYRFLALVNSKYGEHEFAMKYAKKVLDIAEKYDNKAWKVSIYSRMAIIYAKTKDYDSACFYINKCIPLLNIMSPKGRVIVMDNIGYLYQDRNPQLALKYLNMALASYPTVDTYDNLAHIYAKKGLKAKADSLWQTALKTKDVEKRYMVVEAMLKQKKEYGDLKETLELSQRLLVLKDSVNRLKQENNVKELQQEFEAQSKFIAQAEKIKRLKWISAFCLATVFCIILVVWLYVRNKKLKLKAEQLEHAIKIRQYQDAIKILEDKNTDVRSTISVIEKENKNNLHTIEQLKYRLEKLKKQNDEEVKKAKLLYETALQEASIRKWKKSDQIAFLDYYAKIDAEYLLLLDNYKGLSPREKVYLVLQHEGKDEELLKKMMGLSAISLRVMKSRINNKKYVSDRV